SFWRSWTISAQRLGSSFSGSSFTLSSLAHVGLAAGADLRPDRVERCRAGQEERVPVLPAPGQVADVLGHLDRAEVLGFGADHPDPLPAPGPAVAALVALHPVGYTLLDHAGADAVEEHAAVRERAVCADVEDLDVSPRRVVDVEERLVKREAEAVRHLELVLGDDRLQLRLTAARRD